MNLQELLPALQVGGLRFYHRLIRTLTLPNNAGPNDTRIVIGPDLPPELITKYGVAIKAAIIFYRDATQYQYIGITTAGLVVGTVVIAGPVVLETWSITTDGVRAFFRMGDRAGATNTTTEFVAGAGNSVVSFDNATTLVLAGRAFQWAYPGGPLIDNGQGVMVSQPRGLMNAQINAAANSGPLAAETVLFNMNLNWPNGRAFMHTIRFRLIPAGGVLSANVRVRRINLAGGAYCRDMEYIFNGVTSGTPTFVCYMVNTSGADIIQNLALTIAPQGGGTVDVVGNAGAVSSWIVEDCGAAADFPGMNTFV